MNKIEEILGTTKENETWADVFKRIDAVNGIDVRTLTRVVVAILEELDVQKEKTGNNYSIGEAGFGRTYIEPKGDFDFGTNETSEGIAGGTGEPEQESAGIQSGDRPIEEEIQPGLTDTS